MTDYEDGRKEYIVGSWLVAQLPEEEVVAVAPTCPAT